MYWTIDHTGSCLTSELRNVDVSVVIVAKKQENYVAVVVVFVKKVVLEILLYAPLRYCFP